MQKVKKTVGALAGVAVLVGVVFLVGRTVYELDRDHDSRMDRAFPPTVPPTKAGWTFSGALSARWPGSLEVCGLPASGASSSNSWNEAHANDPLDSVHRLRISARLQGMQGS